MGRSEPRRRQRRPGRLSLISATRAGLRAGPLLLALVALVYASGAGAHTPATAIGRAVEALGTVSVSYEEGASVSDIEAGNFPLMVGSDPKVAFMPAYAATELAGGPNVIADEIAREADLDGTLIVLVGRNLGWWSDDIADERLDELAGQARVAGADAPAATVRALVRSVQAEDTSDPPWALIGVAIVVLATGAFAGLHWLSRRRSLADG